MTLKFVEQPNKKGNKPKFLIVLLHGYGSNANDLISLVPELGAGFEDVHFISPNAPYGHDSGFPNMYQWYSLTRMNDSFLYEGAQTAAPILVEFIEKQLRRLNLKPENLVVCGFSQGGMMTLHTFLRYPKKIAGLISFSGYISGHEHLHKEIKSKPSTLLMHGDMDTVVPTSSFYKAKETLEELKVPLEGHMLRGLGHGINYDGIKIATKFLKKLLMNVNGFN